MDFNRAQKILKGFSIPLQPQIVSDLFKVMPDLDKVSEIIHSDPCLSASVIKLVNATERQHPLTIGQLDEAIRSIGLSGVTAIMNAQLLRKAFIGEVQQVFPKEFWKVTNDVAYSCSLMARQLNLSIVENAYYLGLFHNIGMPLIWQKHNDYFETIYQPSSYSVCELEERFFKCSHDIVGYYIAKGMRLDPILCDCIRLHHEGISIFTSNEFSHEIKTTIAILKAAEFIIGEMTLLYNRPDGEEWEQLSSFVLEELALTTDDFDDLAEIIEEEVMTSANES